MQWNAQQWIRLGKKQIKPNWWLQMQDFFSFFNKNWWFSFFFIAFQIKLAFFGINLGFNRDFKLNKMQCFWEWENALKYCNTKRKMAMNVSNVMNISMDIYWLLGEKCVNWMFWLSWTQFMRHSSCVVQNRTASNFHPKQLSHLNGGREMKHCSAASQ